MTINPGEWGVQGMLEEQELGAQFNPSVPTRTARARAAVSCHVPSREGWQGRVNASKGAEFPRKIQNLVLVPSPKMQINAEWGIWNVLLASTRRGSASILSCWWNPILDLASRFTKPNSFSYLMIYDEAKEIWYSFLRQDRIGTAGWSVLNNSTVQSHRLLWQNRGLLGWEGTNPEFLSLSSYPWNSASSLRESVTAWKTVQYILLFFIHIYT